MKLGLQGVLRIAMGSLILLLLIIFQIIRNNGLPKKMTPDSSHTILKEKVVRHLVSVTQTGYDPSTITIKKGEVVVWTNYSGVDVSVNSTPYPTHKTHPVLNLGVFPDGASVQARFFGIGTYTYLNHFNPNQKGSVIVIE